MMNSVVLPQEARAELARRELSRRHLIDFVRYNFPEYRTNWHHKLLTEKLEGIENGTIKRLMVFMPPRHGKSELCSVQFPAWAIGRNPDRNIIEASYSADLSTDFGRQVRNLIADKKYSNVFKNVSLAEDSQAKGKWNTNGRGAYNAVGVGGATTGKGADILLIDDPLKNRQDADSPVVRESTWQWYKSTARTRLSPDGAIVLIMTRWHTDDLAARILAGDNAHLWEVINLPAIATQDEPFRSKGEALWADHFTLDRLEETKADIGIYEWSALYQQNPVASELQEFKPEWFKSKPFEHIEGRMLAKYLTIDTAVSKREEADYTGFVRNYVDRDNNWYFRAHKAKLNSMELIDTIFAMHVSEKFTKIGIEKTTYTMGLKPFIDSEMKKRNIFLPIVELSHNQTAKEIRIRGLIPRYASGSIYHLDNDCKDLEDELITFPRGVHDDVADAAAYQLQLAQQPIKAQVPTTNLVQPFYPDLGV
jgi:hypothetical protein